MTVDIIGLRAAIRDDWPLSLEAVLSLIDEIERLQAERDDARIWHEKAHRFLDERNDFEKRALAAEVQRDALAKALDRASYKVAVLPLSNRGGKLRLGLADVVLLLECARYAFAIPALGETT